MKELLIRQALPVVADLSSSGVIGLAVIVGTGLFLGSFWLHERIASSEEGDKYWRFQQRAHFRPWLRRGNVNERYSWGFGHVLRPDVPEDRDRG